MNKVVTRAIRAVRTMQPVRHASDDKIPFELGPHLLTRPKPKMPKGYERIEKKREIFQADDGVPTFLKGGTFDEVLYRFTALCVLGGNALSLYWIYEMATAP